ncbi:MULTISPECIES: MurR/RpiR family transcriptional regulator [Bradyrhizobium]|uniref:Transcriptional regulatory protein n=1 Tax=Bradyrhizobium diazoefficiens (strain JCM 10833 / BCRC 13528 / IAM 13628 / NBRC 14792 / USDA 110) TaxID=224911 RepID=Q89XK4_BRADU|nr:MurR/RpiR family transcriptional regulator [Bradyrhizobium diazoefficiens]MBP1061031.1 DNA-binding MurR/RpiR family transcriptional regulator [Bradyrhizobium japonicum]AND93395.1 transcriptional regulator [Bradyrhizobium diazoefficiens USDA 110]AWO87397.1 MurR/RpiR family transcriptional regulator [Bradyrhizobium diazoefficiens]PDT60558.1 MurR/RpiR family transcriptional regulator [Bradyrhizobium diazoefficiens]QBP19269.1 MurR/RpiR family transcriptional regulator [Bradyrhizobium diazoeffic
MPRAKRIHPAKAAGTAVSTPSRRDAFVAGDIISVIRQSAPSLSPSEQRVAMALLADVEFAIHASNAELARSARVSEPTVTRFSRSVGCRGVRDLKVRLAQAMAVGRIYVELPPHVGTDLARPALWRSVFQEIRRAIAAAEEGLRKEDIERAAEAISRCSKLAAFGVGGGSTLAAMEVQNRFFRLGIAVSHTSDPSLMRMIAATLGEEDVVVAISTTGAASEVIEAAGIAKQYGALVVAITRPQSRLASIADIALGVHVPEAPDALKPTASRYALLAAIDLLAASTAYCKPLEAQTRMRRIKYELLKGTDGNSNGPLGD